MTFLRVKNFDKFQHYGNRAPIWIKLYNALLDDYDFGLLPDAAKLHLIMIWLLASRHNNLIPADPEWIGRRISATAPVDIPLLVSSGFLETSESASNTLASCKQVASPDKRRVEIEKNPPNPPAGGNGVPKGAEGVAEQETPPDSPGFRRWWSAWPSHDRKVGKSKCLRTWERRSLEPIAEKVISALQSAKASAGWRKQGGEFIPMPMTWLNQSPWETNEAERTRAPEGAPLLSEARIHDI